MGIREELTTVRAKVGPVAAQAVAGLATPMRFRVLSAAEMLALETRSKAVVAAAVDEEGQPLFASVAEFEALPWALARAIYTAFDLVNTLPDVAAARGN